MSAKFGWHSHKGRKAIEYSIKSSPDRVEVIYPRYVDAADVRTMFEAYRLDPAFDPFRPHVVDIRKVATPDIGFAEIFSLFGFFDRHYTASAAKLRVAFIVQEEDIFGLVRIFENLTEQSGWAECAILSTPEEATLWLSRQEETI